MFSYHIQADLASERRRTLLAEAETARQVRQARSDRQRSGIRTAHRPPLRWLAALLGSLRISRRTGPRYAPDGSRAAEEPLDAAISPAPDRPEASKLMV